MNLITTQKHNFIGLFCLQSKVNKGRWILTFCVFLFSNFYSQVFGQKATLHLYSVSPDWNNRSYCGAGSGYHPSKIIAPSVSYSGKDVNDPVYEFYWEKQTNDGEWLVMESSKDSKYIPAFDPKTLFNDKPGGPSMKFSFRLRVVDLANGKQEAISEEYSIFILSGMLASHKIIDSGNSKIIELSVSGGFDEKKFEWKQLQGTSSFSGIENHSQNLSGISEGAYEVLITDGGCPSISYNVNVTKTPTTK